MKIEASRSLAVRFPALATEWHPTLNGELSPNDVTAYSARKVWWHGKCGHDWQTRIKNRTCNKTGCPICSRHGVFVGYNDLATLRPDLASEWDYDKNGNLTPHDITPNSTIKVWWKCPKGLSYKSSPAARNHAVCSDAGGCSRCGL